MKLRKAREFADLSRECPKRAKSDPKNPKQDPNQESDPNSNECSEDEIKLGKSSKWGYAAYHMLENAASFLTFYRE